MALRSARYDPGAFLQRERQASATVRHAANRLVNSAPRLERDWNGNLEIVHVYLCFTHGFYTFRRSEGLQKGL